MPANPPRATAPWCEPARRRRRPRAVAAALATLLGGVLAAAAQPAGPVPARPPACPRGAVAVPVGASLRAESLKAGPGASFCIGAGVHRLQVVEPLAGQRFYGEPGAILNGARVIAAFTRDGAFWSATGIHPRWSAVGSCRGGGRDCLQALALFRDGALVPRATGRATLGPGRYLLEPADGRVVLADDPAGHLIEVGTARYAFRGTAPDVRIAGLVVEKYDSPLQEGAIQGEFATGWQVEGSEIRLNGGAGVSVGTDGVIRGNAIHHNGQLGATAGGRRILLENNAIFANNTGGFDPAWEAGGVKITQSEEVVLRGNHAHHNAGPGLWCDIDCRKVVFADNRVEHNSGAGIFYEISAEAVIRDNVLSFNGGSEPDWYWGADIQVAAARDVDVAGNTIAVRPDGRAIMLIDQARRNAAGAFYATTGNRVHDNRITFAGPGSAGGVSDVGPGSPNAGIIASGGNSFDRNTYIAPAGVAPRFIWGLTPLDLAGFRGQGQERAGVLAEP